MACRLIDGKISNCWDCNVTYTYCPIISAMPAISYQSISIISSFPSIDMSLSSALLESRRVFGHRTAVTAIDWNGDWSPDGKLIGVGLATDTISFVEVLSGTVHKDKEKIFEADVNKFRWTPDGC